MMTLLSTIIAAALAGCSPSGPDKKDPPPERPLEDGQHFCCDTVDHAKQTGEGCVTIGPSHVELCPNVLYCSGNWSKTEDGHAQCNKD